MNLLLAIWCVSLTLSPKNETAQPILATGPSSAMAKITPVAVSEEGIILCLTESFSNPMGAHAMMDTEFGYLTVDKNGLWEEKVITVFEGTDHYDSLELFREKFYAEIDFDNIPEHLKEIIGRHRIDRLIYQSGSNKYFWTKNGIYDGNDVLKKSKNEQKSIHGFRNIEGKGTRVGTSYALYGVLFFTNKAHYDENGDDLLLIGAAFFETDFEFPIELYEVTGICLLP